MMRDLRGSFSLQAVSTRFEFDSQRVERSCSSLHLQNLRFTRFGGRSRSIFFPSFRAFVTRQENMILEINSKIHAHDAADKTARVSGVARIFSSVFIETMITSIYFLYLLTMIISIGGHVTVSHLGQHSNIVTT